MKKLNILLLCNRPVKNADASTVTDHLDAFTQFSRHKVYCLSFVRKLPKHLDLNRFDVIVVHYSIALGHRSEHYLDRQAKQKIRDFSGLKVIFIQDEYRAVNVVLEALRFMGIHVLFTCVPDGEVDKVYSSSALPGLTKVNTLTGYVPEALLTRDVSRIKDRPVHVGYRTRRFGYWLGELGFEKIQIADRFTEHTRNSGLRLDISYEESQRIYGGKWIDFVGSCKAMLGTESGASVFDFSGELQERVDRYQAEHPEADFLEIQERFLRPYEGKIRLNQISPRCFESAALRTAMVLYEGNYSGILEPWRHYVPLKKDFSNIDEVVAILKNDERLQGIADCAFVEIAQNPKYSYKSFIEGFDRVVGEEMKALERPQAREPYTKPLYYAHLAVSLSYVVYRISSVVFQRVVLATPLRRIVFDVWRKLPLDIRQSIRPLLRLIGR